MSPYPLARQRQYNRDWHKIEREGRCEALTQRGARCPFRGMYDGQSGQVRCGIHVR